MFRGMYFVLALQHKDMAKNNQYFLKKLFKMYNLKYNIINNDWHKPKHHRDILIKVDNQQIKTNSY